MPSSDMIFAVGPFTALPPINGLTTSDGTRRAWSAARSARHRQDRVDAEIGIRGTDDDPFDAIPGKRVDHAGSGQGGRGALVANRANPRGAAQLDEVFLKAEIAVLGIETGRDA